MGESSEYLSDLHPDRIMLGRISPESLLEHAKDLERRWNEVREPLGTLAVGHPNERVRQLTDRTIVAVHGTWHWVLWMLTAYSMERDWTDFSKEARKEWEAATSLLHELREALHEAA
jgi:transposase-like protein